MLISALDVVVEGREVHALASCSVLSPAYCLLRARSRMPHASTSCYTGVKCLDSRLDELYYDC